MRACSDGYPSCRMAEAGKGWCTGECVGVNTQVRADLQRELIKATVRAHGLTDLTTAQARTVLETIQPYAIRDAMKRDDIKFAAWVMAHAAGMKIRVKKNMRDR